jgi:hypothetical protein
MSSNDPGDAAPTIEPDPRPGDSYLTFVFRQIAPKARRLARWTVRISAMVVILLVVLPAGRLVNRNVTAFWTKWHESRRTPSPIADDQRDARRSLTVDRLAPSPMGATITPAESSPAAPTPSALPLPRRAAPREPTAAAVITRQVPSSPRPALVSVPEGTPITVELLEEISSDRNAPGDLFKGLLVEDLTSDGHIIAPAQTKVYGRISRIQRGSRSENPTVTIELESLNVPGGRVALSTVPVTIEGKRQSRAKKILKGLGGAVAGAIVGGKLDGKKGVVVGAGLGTMVAIKGDSLVLSPSSISRFHLAHSITFGVAQQPPLTASTRRSE